VSLWRISQRLTLKCTNAWVSISALFEGQMLLKGNDRADYGWGVLINAGRY